MAVVLVVDDDAKFARVVARCLDRAGYGWAVAASGEEALSSVADLAPDAIVLDVMMPGLSGIEVCRRLRGRGWGGSIVIVSARSSTTDRRDAVEVGADAYLAKPFPLDELLSTLGGLVAAGHLPAR
jgi:DNA-binding response OmpR family regulator